MAHWIVEECLDATTTSGESFALDVRIGQPYSVAANEWACSVALQGLYQELHDIHGGSSLQALCLAASLARQLLMAFVEGGGTLRYRGTDDKFDIVACFSRVGEI